MSLPYIPDMTSPSMLSLAKEHIAAAYTDASNQISDVFNSLSRPTDSKAPRPLEEVQEECEKRLSTKKNQALIEFTKAFSNEVDSKSKTYTKFTSNPDFRGSKLTSRERSRDSLTLIPSNNTDSDTTILYEWYWNDDRGKDIPYDPYTTNLLEREYLKDKKATVKMTHGFYGATTSGYSINFEKMTQIKVETGFERKIQRKMKWMKVDEHKKKVSELEEKIRKMEQQLAAQNITQSTGKKKM